MAGETVNSIDMLRKLVAFDTTSRNSNLALIEYVQGYLKGHGVESKLVPNEDGSKANLFRETVFQPVNDYLNEFIASELPADGPMEMSPENLRKFTSRLFEVITENAPLIKALVASFDYEDGDVSDIADLTSLNAYFSKSQSQLDLILSDESREIIKRSDIFVRIIFSSFLSLSLFGKWIFPEKNFDAREVVGIMQDMIIRGYGMDPSK